MPGIMLILLGLVLIIVDAGLTTGFAMPGLVIEGIVALIADLSFFRGLLAEKTS